MLLRVLACVLLLDTALAAEDLPPWAGRVPGGGAVRIAVPSPANPRFAHLSWPKAVRTANGTIVLAYLAGTHHGDESCPAVSISTDGGNSFSAPNVLREFGPGMEYTNSGNVALGLAHDGAVLLLAHGMKGNTANNIFGWRSIDGGRSWQPVNTSSLGPNKTGSSTGAIAQLPGRQLMVVGHYRAPSKPYSLGIWQSTSPDDGLSWGEPALVTNLDAGEPTLLRAGNRLLVFIRGRGPADGRQFISVSDDWGKTWRTELSTITTRGAHASGLTHPFVMLAPENPHEIVDITFERPLPATADLWRGSVEKLEFKWERTLLELPKIEGDAHIDFGYPWALPTAGGRALLFYYHGKSRGKCDIWVADILL